MRRGRCLFFLSVLCVFFLLMALPYQANAVSGTLGGLTWEYNEQNTTLTITGQGAMVHQEHFYWGDAYKTCTKIVIGEGVTTICHGAFNNFLHMKEVVLPTTLTKIDAYGFNGCSTLYSVELPAGLQEIGYGAFSGCYSLKTINLPEGLKTIGTDAFAQCRNLIEITIPDSVTTIGGSAFISCDKLERVTLSKNLTEMGGNVFSDCVSLKAVTIPDKVPSIGGYAFNNCTSLQSVTIGAGVKNIESTAFWGCPNIKSFTLSAKNGSFHVDKGILYNKEKTTLLLAPQGFSGGYSVLPGTKTIGEYSFYECRGLTDITIPDSVTLIDAYGFSWCTSLKSVKLGSSLENIRVYAFSYTALSTITLPATVRNVGEVAFASCKNLKEVIFLGKKPIFNDNTFFDVTATCYHNSDKSWKNLTNYGGRLTWKEVDCNGEHTVVTQPAKGATCQADGVTEGSYCSRCGQVLQKQTTIPASHNYGSWETIQSPTTQTEGKAQRICQRCGHTDEKTLTKLTQETEPQLNEQIPVVSPTEQTQEATEHTEETAQPTTVQEQDTSGGKRAKGTWIVWLIVGVVVAVDAATGVIYLKKRKNKKQ